MFLYRILLSLFALVILTGLILRGRWKTISARLGGGTPETGEPYVWLHAASNGELTSARPLVDGLLNSDPALHLLITCNSETGVALAQSWKHPRIQAQLAPLDLVWTTRRIYRKWAVRSLILLESELWPNRVLLCPGSVMLIGARLTERTAKGWRKLGGLVPRVLSKVAYMSAQDAGSRQRLIALGLPASACGPDANLKALYTASPLPDTADVKALQAQFDRSRTWLAGSTHEGEDIFVLTAHKALLEKDPDLRLILAPRHPKRAAEIKQIGESLGLSVAMRSAGDAPDGHDVYLADTLGEMALWYTLSGIVFVGGSLVDKGGHTPFEPAAYGCAILHGPYTRNFAAAYQDLAQNHAGLHVENAQDIADAVNDLVSNGNQPAKGATAKATLAQATDFPKVMQSVVVNLHI